MPYFIFLFISLLWGTSFILMKKAVLVFGPISVAGLRVGGGFIVLFILIRIVGYSWKVKRKEILYLLPVTLLGSIYPYSIQPHLISKYDSSFIAIIVSLVPFLTILVSIPLLGIWPNRWQIMGVLGGLFCMGFLFSDGLDRNISSTDLWIALTVPLSYALTNTLIKKHLSHIQAPILTFLYLGIATLFLIPLGVGLEEINYDGDILLAIGAILLLGIFATGLAILLFYKLIQEQGPLFAGMVTYIIPLIALLWGWADAEKITLLQVSALLGILLSVFFVQKNTLTLSIKNSDSH